MRPIARTLNPVLLCAGGMPLLIVILIATSQLPPPTGSHADSADSADSDGE